MTRPRRASQRDANQQEDGSWTAPYVRSRRVASQDDGDVVRLDSWEVVE